MVQAPVSTAIDTIVFDIGWVLVHLQPARLLDVLRTAGAEVQSLPEVTSRIALLEHECGRLDGPGLIAGLAALAPRAVAHEQLTEAWIDMFEPQWGMLQMLAALRTHYRVFLLSNVGPLHWTELCRRWMLHERADLAVTSFEAGVMKPDPGIYAIAEQRCDLSPERTVFIDDLPQNIATARQRGWHGIVHQSELATREALLTLGVQCEPRRP